MLVQNRLVLRLPVGLLAVGFLSLLAIVGMTDWLGRQSHDLFNEAMSSRDMRAAAVELRNALLAAESSERGYVLTGSEIYLAPYNGARSAARAKVVALQKGSTSKREAEQTRILASIVTQKFEHTDRVIELKRDRKEAEALSLIRTNRAKSLMDEANIFLSGLIASADERQTATSKEQSENARLLGWISLFGALIIVGVVSTVTYSGIRNIRVLAASRAELDAFNSSLEQRVITRTDDLARERDRAGVLVKEINHHVANSLALTASMVSLQSKASGDPALRAALAETRDRILAIADVHKRLYLSDDAQSVSLDEYLGGILEQMKNSLRTESRNVALHYDLDPIQMPTDASVNLGIVVTEWVTNALKYAYPGRAGDVRVRLKRIGGELAELAVEDDGVGRDGARVSGSGLGTKIVTAMATAVNAKVQYENRQPGTLARMTFQPPLVH